MLGLNMSYKKIDLIDLPQYSPWPARLLGLSQWSMNKRTIEKTEAEYNQDKYLACINKLHETKNNISMQEMKRFENGDDSTELCISIDDQLFLTTLSEARSKLIEEISKTLHSHILKSSTVVELASGYGYNLWSLAHNYTGSSLKWIGGEYAENAVTIGNALSEENIRIEKFNFYQTPYTILDKASGPITIFTVFGVHQLPDATDVLKGLRPYKDKIQSVVYFESIYEHCDSNTLLGLMRKRYIEMCDYNTNMLNILKSAEDVEIISEKKNVIGLNPLLPISIIEWKFK